MNDEITQALEKIFAADSDLYRGRGFMRRVGFGERPALVNIDLANRLGSAVVAIDERIAPEPGEQVERTPAIP